MTNLPVITRSPRDTQSIAFFRMPGTEWLYSGVTNSTPSASLILFLKILTISGGSSSSSWSKNGRFFNVQLFDSHFVFKSFCHKIGYLLIV